MQDDSRKSAIFSSILLNYPIHQLLTKIFCFFLRDFFSESTQKWRTLTFWNWSLFLYNFLICTNFGKTVAFLQDHSSIMTAFLFLSSLVRSSMCDKQQWERPAPHSLWMQHMNLDSTPPCRKSLLSVLWKANMQFNIFKQMNNKGLQDL